MRITRRIRIRITQERRSGEMHTSEWWRTTRTKFFTTRRRQSPKYGEAKRSQHTMEMKKQTHK
eukprot:13335940-Heterocapsa_arctica.AAC.1